MDKNPALRFAGTVTQIIRLLSGDFDSHGPFTLTFSVFGSVFGANGDFFLLDFIKHKYALTDAQVDVKSLMASGLFF